MRSLACLGNPVAIEEIFTRLYMRARRSTAGDWPSFLKPSASGSRSGRVSTTSTSKTSVELASGASPCRELRKRFMAPGILAPAYALGPGCVQNCAPGCRRPPLMNPGTCEPPVPERRSPLGTSFDWHLSVRQRNRIALPSARLSHPDPERAPALHGSGSRVETQADIRHLSFGELRRTATFGTAGQTRSSHARTVLVCTITNHVSANSTRGVTH